VIGRTPASNSFKAISIGFRLINAIVDELIHHENPTAIYTYRGHYNSSNAKLDSAALSISKKIL
jgi:hypothetical protein